MACITTAASLFSYFSPGYAIGTVTGGPFGVNQQLAFRDGADPARRLNSLQLLHSHLRRPADGGDPFAPPTVAPSGCDWKSGQPLYRRAKSPAPTNPKSSDSGQLSAESLSKIGNGGQPISLGVYDRANKLPYTFNYTLDIQWQPRNDVAIDIGYVGNVGRHQVIPVPFNQPGISRPRQRRFMAKATPTVTPSAESTCLTELRLSRRL